jgi:hypothetical protein
MEFLEKLASSAMALFAPILFNLFKIKFIFMLPVLTASSLDGRGLEDK